MKTFAQLKKDIKIGTTIKTICNNIKPEKNGQVRKIAKVQTNAIVFEDLSVSSGLSWLWWQKASNYEYDGNIFKVYHTSTKGERVLDFIYEIIGA